MTRKARPEQADAETGAVIEPLGDKLQKVLAEAGLGSRREMERWIKNGRVVVNGEPAHLGQRVGPDARIAVDGKSLKPRARKGVEQGAAPRVLLYNKPVGELCTRKDPEGRKTIFDNLPELGSGRWISIGRLDIATGGLLLLSTDGTLANRMMHPSTGLDREYAVRVNGMLSDEQCQALMSGIEDEGELIAFSDIQYYNGRGTNHWYHVVLMEGKNREIRRLFESCGLMVSRLKRSGSVPWCCRPGWPVAGMRIFRSTIPGSCTESSSCRSPRSAVIGASGRRRNGRRRRGECVDSVSGDRCLADASVRS